MVFNILQWNINGYINNYSELQLLIKSRYPKIIALQETHLHNTPHYSIIPKNYKYIHTNDIDSTDTAKRGLALLVSNNVQFSNLQLRTNILAQAIEIKSDVTFVIINTYISPTDQISERDLLTLISSINKPVLIMGDLNAWSPEWGSRTFNSRGQLISTFIENNNLMILNDKSPTHLSTRSSLTNVDVSLSSPSLFLSTEWKRDDYLHGSDHFPIHLTLFKKSSNHIKKPPRFILKHANWEKYQSILIDSIPNFNPSPNVNKTAATITKFIHSAAKKSVPQTNNWPRRYTVCWWNKKLFLLRQEKQRLWKNSINSFTMENILLYKKANAVFKREVKLAKRVSFVNFTKEINPNSSSSQLWQKVNLLSGISTCTKIHSIEQVNGLLTTNSRNIATSLGQFWSNYSKDTQFPNEFVTNKTRMSNFTPPLYILNNKAIQIETPFSKLELQSCLASLKGSTPGQDRLSYQFYKNLPNEGMEKLIELFNDILISGIIPQQWKIAMVIPICKPEKPKHRVENYRPISLLPCISKIIEKMISKRLMWYLEEQNLISANQYAFRSGKGTTEALLMIDEIICNTLSSGNHISLLSFDSEKAFDRIGIHAVIDQLVQWKVGPRIINFVLSFLKNRKMRILVNDSLSSLFPLDNGIPQGSPLSVTLFLVATNKLNIIIKNHKYFKHTIYADDLCLFIKFTNTDTFLAKLLNLYNEINEWCQYSGTKFSIQKSKHLHICKKLNCEPININLNSLQIENVENLRILGLYFNNRYLWNEHVKLLCTNLKNRLNIVKCLSNHKLECNVNSLLNIVRSIILSKIDYGLQIYSATSQNNLNKIKSIYHNALRLALGAYRSTPINNIMAESGFQHLSERIEQITARTLINVLFSDRCELSKLAKNKIKRKNMPRKSSALQRVISISNQIEVNPLPIKKKKLNCPPWKLPTKSVILDLAENKKANTNPDIFKQMFLNVKEDHQTWKPIFTDGSKTDVATTFSVVDDHNRIINIYQLPQYTSIFSAEALGVLCATKYADQERTKHIIYTDSLSVAYAVLNTNNKDSAISSIRDILSSNNNIKICWVPSHTGISGNSEADEAARFATSAPLHIHQSHNKDDLKSLTKRWCKTKMREKWSMYEHHYKQFNPNLSNIQYPSNIPRKQTINFTRCRLGHSRATHPFDPSQTPPICKFCNVEIFTMKHLLEECQIINQIKQTHNLPLNMFEILSSPEPNNIKIFNNFLQKLHMVYEI